MMDHEAYQEYLAMSVANEDFMRRESVSSQSGKSLARDLDGRFVSPSRFSLDEDLSDQPEVPYGFHYVSNTEAKKLQFCDLIFGENIVDPESALLALEDPDVQSELNLRDEQNAKDEHADDDPEEDEDVEADQLRQAQQELVAKRYEQTTLVHYDSEVVEIRRVFTREVRVNSSYRNRRGRTRMVYGPGWSILGEKFVPGQHRHNRNDTRRVRKDGKVIGNNHRHKESFGEEMATEVVTHVLLDAQLFKVGRNA